jgi:hypothetical protein
MGLKRIDLWHKRGIKRGENEEKEHFQGKLVWQVDPKTRQQLAVHLFSETRKHGLHLMLGTIHNLLLMSSHDAITICLIIA